jgi:hypothetical protein
MKMYLAVLAATVTVVAMSVEAAAVNYPRCREKGSYEACIACKLAQGATNSGASQTCSRPKRNKR